MFGSQYAPSQEQEVEGSGSGIIIGKTDSELLIATNYHVVDGQIPCQLLLQMVMLMRLR